jgi:hypothetical protein
MLLHAAAAPRQLCFFVAPTLKQAAEIAWTPLIDLAPSPIVRRIRRSDLEIELINGSIIRLCGPSHLRGSGLNYVVLDEYAHCSQPELWSEVVRPMLADRQGQAFICSTPHGLNHFYELYSEAKNRNDCATFQFPTHSGGFVPAPELELLRSTMDARSYAQEIEARFEPKEGRIYFAFSSEMNVREVTPDPYLKLLVGIDFNVSQMSAVIAQRVRDECHIVDEICLKDSNTYELMAVLTQRYPEGGIVHPDPTGFARKTSAQAGVTDHSIIQEYGWNVYRTKPYPIVNRINGVNALLRNANGRTRLWIDPKCKNLIRSLDGLVYKPDTNIPDKSTGLDHMGDALGYLVGAVFPSGDPSAWSMRDAITGADLMD